MKGALPVRVQLSINHRYRRWPPFPRFAALPEKWEKGAEYVALFPNLLLGMHNDHAFRSCLHRKEPDEPLNRWKSITLMKPPVMMAMPICATQ